MTNGHLVAHAHAAMKLNSLLAYVFTSFANLNFKSRNSF
jgi:hypothetical protein